MNTIAFTPKFRAIVTSVALLSTGVLPAQTVVNGSFESGTNPGSDFIEVAAVNSSTISGWTVSAGTVDYIGGRWAPKMEVVQSI